jgi:hypothetical protein
MRGKGLSSSLGMSRCPTGSQDSLFSTVTRLQDGWARNYCSFLGRGGKVVSSVLRQAHGAYPVSFSLNTWDSFPRTKAARV